MEWYASVFAERFMPAHKIISTCHIAGRESLEVVALRIMCVEASKEICNHSRFVNHQSNHLRKLFSPSPDGIGERENFRIAQGLMSRHVRADDAEFDDSNNWLNLPIRCAHEWSVA